MKVSIFTLLTIVTSIFIVAHVSAVNFLEEEAGICAYMNAGRSIDLSKVKPIYRTVEHETNKYVIGSVPIADYAETEDVHLYVHKDGWIVAYYFADEPASKIIDWRNYQGTAITSTKLELALTKVTNAINVPIVDVKYYDFVTPQANKLLIVVDKEEDSATDTFDIMIPNDIIIYERSWGLYGIDTTSTLYIDNNNIKSFTIDNVWNFNYGKLTPDQLTQGVFHTVKVQNQEALGYRYGGSAGGIVLVYQQP